ncbi:hypothetical protein CSUI_007486, partial [Cystoisospora suis]
MLTSHEKKKDSLHLLLFFFPFFVVLKKKMKGRKMSKAFKSSSTACMSRYIEIY